jgi:hypothetical protein
LKSVWMFRHMSQSLARAARRYAARGAAWARWPSRSSKPVRSCSPRLGRFDSCAAPIPPLAAERPAESEPLRCPDCIRSGYVCPVFCANSLEHKSGNVAVGAPLASARPGETVAVWTELAQAHARGPGRARRHPRRRADPAPARLAPYYTLDAEKDVEALRVRERTVAAPTARHVVAVSVARVEAVVAEVA